jgi:hypothetical protein
MSLSDEERIIAEIRSWGSGEFGSGFTWAQLESKFGFARQSLNQKPRIKAEYLLAKQALAGGNGRSRDAADKELRELRLEVASLREQITGYRHQLAKWKARWQRIAFHIRQRGMHVHELDRDVSAGAPGERETADLLRPFDRPIPPAH